MRQMRIVRENNKKQLTGTCDVGSFVEMARQILLSNTTVSISNGNVHSNT